MQLTELIYHIITLVFSIILFELKITARNNILEFILQSASKLCALYVLFYSGIQIFKYLGII